MVGADKMQDRKGHCPMMVTVDVKVEEPGHEEEDEQGSEEEGVNLPPLKVAGGAGLEVAAVGAASARRNEAGEPCASSHEESSKTMRV